MLFTLNLLIVHITIRYDESTFWFNIWVFTKFSTIRLQRIDRYVYLFCFIDKKNISYNGEGHTSIGIFTIIVCMQETMCFLVNERIRCLWLCWTRFHFTRTMQQLIFVFYADNYQFEESHVSENGDPTLTKD